MHSCLQTMGFGGFDKGKGKKTTIVPEKTVWLGGVPAAATFQDLLALGKQAGNAKWAEILKGGTAAIGFASAEEAASAASALNGAMVGHAAIVAGPWEKKSGGGGGGGWNGGGKSWGGGGNGGGKSAWKPQFQKSWNDGGSWGKGGGGKGKGKDERPFDKTKVVWLGGVPEGATYQDLLELGKQAGPAKWAEVKRNGVGMIGYASAEDVAAAVAALDGAMVGDTAIQADVYTKKSN